MTFEDIQKIFYDLNHAFIENTASANGIERHACWLTRGEQRAWHFSLGRTVNRDVNRDRFIYLWEILIRNES